VSGSDAVGSFAVNPDGLQVFPRAKQGWALVRATSPELFARGDRKS
jgi:hypothetical protein